MTIEEIKEKENAERERNLKDFVENYKPCVIDAQKFKDAKEHPSSFVFSKMEIMQELGWKNGTFYNRLKRLEFNHLELNFQNKYIKKKEEGDKVEKLIFSYEAFCDFLTVYYIIDLKWNRWNEANSQNTVSNSQESIKNESNNSQVDSNIDSNTIKADADEKIELYKEIIRQKDSMIESLKMQVEELTNILKVKEQKDFEMARIEAIKQQKQLLINDAEGNKKESLFFKIFNFRKNKKEDIDE